MSQTVDYKINSEDLICLIDAEIADKGFTHAAISSANDFYGIGIPQIISNVFEINQRVDDIQRDGEFEKGIDHITVKINFENVVVKKPTILNYTTGKDEVVFPNTAVIKEKTYKGEIRVTIKAVITAIMRAGAQQVKETRIENVKLCKLPIMVGSKWCNTYGLSKEAKVRLREDPLDHGGYFIIKGVEWSIDNIENVLFNKVRIFNNEGYGKEMIRAEFISKPGDFYLNSDQFIIRWMVDGQITIEIRRNNLKEIEIPFYLVFRAMGWNSDRQIFDNVLYEYESHLSRQMQNFLKKAFNVKYTKLHEGRNIYQHIDVMQYLAENIDQTPFEYLKLYEHPENYQKIISILMDQFDLHFLQHIGTDKGSRHNKLRFLCVLLRKMFLVYMDKLKQTDRDSYNSKRVAAAGVNYAKTFKTFFNQAIVQNIRGKVTKDLKSMPFSKFNAKTSIESGIYGLEFERNITQAITSGNKSEITVGNTKRVNRLSSQMMVRRNELNALAIVRQVTAASSDSSKQSERAKQMRAAHPSTIGSICLVHASESEKVGLTKQLAMTCTITSAVISKVIKDILLLDKDILPLDTVDHKQIGEEQLKCVYVNGDLIGFCKSGIECVKKYRQKRRNFEFSPLTTIVWDDQLDDAYFWLDTGRCVRPLLIVYNNIRPEDAEMCKKYKVLPAKDEIKDFTQFIAMTSKHINGLLENKYTIDDMVRLGIVEYISAEEQENMYLAASFDTLRDEKNNILREFTHCDIPQAQVGITTLTSPFSSHNQTQRIVYQTAQSKQTCGVFARNWPFRGDKETFLQYNNEMPLVKTLINRYLNPNGTNCILAFACYTGFNQEDSIVMNASAVGRGLFNGSKFTSYKSKLEQHEEFATPSEENTNEIKSGCYDKLVNGIIKKGTVVKKNDVLIGKVMKITKNADAKYMYTDRSLVYKEDEEAIVHDVICDRDEDDEQFCKVVLRKKRPVKIGDKFSVRGTSQVFTLEGWKQIKDITMRDLVATLTHDDKLAFVHPSGLSSYYYGDDMYSLKTDDLEIFVTKNHKLYCSETGYNFQLCPAESVKGRNVYHKKNIDDKIIDFDKFLQHSMEPFEIQEHEMDQYTMMSLYGGFAIRFSRKNNVMYACVEHNNQPASHANGYQEKMVAYTGLVYCLEIPDRYQHVYYSRESDTAPATWTGNSARSGQKATVGLMLDEADMPRTVDGIVPTVIMNPHSIPSRMTIGQEYESAVGNLCAKQSAQIDATIFKGVDIDVIAEELSKLGMNSYGYHRMYSGMTGEWIDCEIFAGPTFYQRLQKFTADTQYAVANGPSDAITYQPLDGKGSSGGLRLGEMERDVLSSHSGAKVILEKFFGHSDGYLHFRCRCGRPAIVNTRKKIYRCNYCGDNADIWAFHTSWSSKAFLQEMSSMNVNVSVYPEPFVQNIQQ
jgi:DNA-directed RNA polymerase II subunit RPB2